MPEIILLGLSGNRATFSGARQHCTIAATRIPRWAPGDLFKISARVGSLAPLALAAVTALPSPAVAQLGGGGLGYGGILPNVGTDARIGDLRPQLEGFLQPTTPTYARPAWLIQPAIEADVGVTDNALRTSTPRRADVFTTISPQLLLSGDTPRLNVALSYNPEFTFYANNSSQNQIYQFFNGQALAAIVPDAVFLDLRGAITQSSLTSGGFNQYQTQSFSAQNSVQTITFGISPYAQHRFGEWGTGVVRYTLDRSLQDTPTNQAFNNSNPALQNLGQSGFGSIGNLTTQQELATFTSGENLGRYNDIVSLGATQYSGSGSYHGAYREEAQNEFNIAINHKWALLTGIGYQNIYYAGVPGIHIKSGTYNIGFRYTPNPDTTLTLEYGRHDGNSDASFDGQYSPTARTRILARYSNGITSDLQQAQGQLNSTTVGTTGLVTDTSSGAPVLNNNYNGVQNGIYRLKQFSATFLFLQDRDTYSLDIVNQQRTALTTTPTTLGNGVVPSGTSTNSTFGSLSWQHDLAPDLSFVATGSYGISSNTNQFIGIGNQNQRTLGLTAALNKQFTQTLSGTARYTYYNQSGGQFVATNGINTGNYTENLVLLGLHKSF